MSGATRATVFALLSLIARGVPGAHEVAISEAQMQQLGIALATVTVAESASTQRLPARVVVPPPQERMVSAPEAGLVSQVLAGVGEAVQAGARLARLESAELVGLQTAYLQAASELRLAEADLQRDERLLREGIIAERRLLETRSRHEQAVARLEERRQVLGLAGLSDAEIAALAASRRLSGGLEVRAPTDGVVLEALVTAGQRVERAQPLFRLARLAPVWLEVRLPLDRVRGIAPGSAVALPCEGVPAAVTLVGQSVDPSTQTVLVRAEVPDPRGCVSPGQFVEVRLELAAAGAELRLPAAALVRSGEQTVVFAREPFGFTARLVRVTAEQAGYAVVTGAVKAGESVAVSGLAALKAAWLAAGGTAE